MTMTELLVAVAVLSIMVLGFGQLLTSSQKVVKETQTNQQQNSVAQSIADVIRADLGKLTKNGFLCITQTSNWFSRPRLIFTTAGVIPSKTHAVVGTGGISLYGHADMDVSSGYSHIYSEIMLRQGWVMSTDSVTGVSDVWNTDLETITTMDREDLNDLIGNCGLTSGTLIEAADFTLDYPPTNLTDIESMWQILSTQNASVDIMWTDGTTSGGNLNWYGINWDGNYNVNWKNEPSSKDDFDSTEIKVSTSSQWGYRALWSHHNQEEWPKAIKISFRVYDQSMAEGLQRETSDEYYKRYEVIVPLD